MKHCKKEGIFKKIAAQVGIGTAAALAAEAIEDGVDSAIVTINENDPSPSQADVPANDDVQVIAYDPDTAVQPDATLENEDVPVVDAVAADSNSDIIMQQFASCHEVSLTPAQPDEPVMNEITGIVANWEDSSATSDVADMFEG